MKVQKPAEIGVPQYVEIVYDKKNKCGIIEVEADDVYAQLKFIKKGVYELQIGDEKFRLTGKIEYALGANSKSLPSQPKKPSRKANTGKS